MDTPQNIIGPQLRRLRYERGLSQEQLAAQLTVRGVEMTRGTLAKIESQVRCVKDFDVAAIANAVGIAIPSLFPPRAASLARRPAHARTG